MNHNAAQEALWMPEEPEGVQLPDALLLQQKIERSLLSILMAHTDKWDEVLPYLAEQNFVDKRHRFIFSALQGLVENRQPVDPLILGEVLEREDRLAAAGGLVYLIEISQEESWESPDKVLSYAKMVHDHAILRGLEQAGREIAKLPRSSQGKPTQELLQEAEEKVVALLEKQGATLQDLRIIKEFLGDFVTELEETCKRKGQITGLATGFQELDEKTSGMHPGQLLIIAGRPAMGKTAIAMNIVEHVACTEKKSVAVFSMEMPAKELLTRHISSLGNVPQQKMRFGLLGGEDWPSVVHAVGILNTAPLYLDVSPSLTVSEMRAKLKTLQRKSGLDLVVVDYLQLMNAGSKHHGNRVAEISEISRGLKLLAKELGVPVIALSQLNRSLESRTDKRPQLSDLRESGAIEQDADLILLLYREEVYHKDKEEVKGLAEVIIGKQRNGPTGTVRMRFLGECSRFSDAPSEEEPYEHGYNGFR